MGGPPVHILGYAPDHPQWAAVWTGLGRDLADIIRDAARNGAELDATLRADQLWLHTAGRPVLTLHGPGTVIPPGQWLVETASHGTGLWAAWLMAAMLRVHQLAPLATRLASDSGWNGGWQPARQILARRFGAGAGGYDHTSPLVSAGDAFAGMRRTS